MKALHVGEFHREIERWWSYALPSHNAFVYSGESAHHLSGRIQNLNALTRRAIYRLFELCGGGTERLSVPKFILVSKNMLFFVDYNFKRTDISKSFWDGVMVAYCDIQQWILQHPGRTPLACSKTKVLDGRWEVPEDSKKLGFKRWLFYFKVNSAAMLTFGGPFRKISDKIEKFILNPGSRGLTGDCRID